MLFKKKNSYQKSIHYNHYNIIINLMNNKKKHIQCFYKFLLSIFLNNIFFLIYIYFLIHSTLVISNF